MTTEKNEFSFPPTPQEALDELRAAELQVMSLQLEIIDALRHHIGYSLIERLRLKWQFRKYARIGKRIYNAMYTLPEVEVPPRHPLVDEAYDHNPEPTNLNAALDDLRYREDGAGVVVGHLSKGQRVKAYGRAKQRGYILEMRKLFDGCYSLTRISSVEGLRP